MARSEAKTVTEYIAALPDDQARAVKEVRKVIKKHLPKGYKEGIGWGAIIYGIPLSEYPDTHNKQPLCYVGLAAQKNYCSLYLMSAYSHKPHQEQLKEAFKKAGKKLNMGKSCVRFRDVNDLELDVIGKLIAEIPPRKWIEIYESVRQVSGKARGRDVREGE